MIGIGSEKLEDSDDIQQHWNRVRDEEENEKTRLQQELLTLIYQRENIEAEEPKKPEWINEIPEEPKKHKRRFLGLKPRKRLVTELTAWFKQLDSGEYFPDADLADLVGEKRGPTGWSSRVTNIISLSIWRAMKSGILVYSQRGEGYRRWPDSQSEPLAITNKIADRKAKRARKARRE